MTFAPTAVHTGDVSTLTITQTGGPNQAGQAVSITDTFYNSVGGLVGSDGPTPLGSLTNSGGYGVGTFTTTAGWTGAEVSDVVNVFVNETIAGNTNVGTFTFTKL